MIYGRDILKSLMTRFDEDAQSFALTVLLRFFEIDESLSIRNSKVFGIWAIFRICIMGQF